MSVTTYEFSCALAGFFEIDSDDARRLLPARFAPLEVRYGRSILLVNFYRFTESEVGPYDELVYGIMTLPRVTDGVIPNGSVFPFQVATTTEASRAHAIERWHLPHWPGDVEVEWREEQDRVVAEAFVRGAPVVTLEVEGQDWNKNPLLFQSFMEDDQGAYMAQIRYDGEVTEHEEGTASLSLVPDHPFNAPLAQADFDDLAFREIWQRGMQTFQPLVTLD